MPPKRPAAERKGRAAPQASEAELMELFLETELLKALPEPVLRELARGKADLREVEAGQTVLSLPAGRSEKSPLMVLLAGALRLMTPDGSGKLLPLNAVLPHEVFFDKAYDPEGALALELQAVQPCRIVEIGYQDANAILRDQPGFKAKFLEILKLGTDRKQRFFDDADIRPVAEFLTERGLVGLQRLKVKRLDKCIDCDACFEACAERRGVSRLGDYKAKFERVGIPYNCHSCVNPACVSACRFGHINLVSGELIISDDCAGCSKCAKACPYEAITTLPLDAVPDGFLDRSPNAKGKQLAVKCDDCIEYEDQACISSCPTGAIFQVASPELKDHIAVFALKSAKALDKLGWQGVIDVEKPPWGGWKVLFIAALVLATLLVGYESAGRRYLYRNRGETVVNELIAQGVPKGDAKDMVERDGPDVYALCQTSPKPLVEAGVSEKKAKAIHEKLAAQDRPPWERDWRTRYYSITAAAYHLGLRSVAPDKGGKHSMRPGNNLSMLLGYFGALAMLLSQLYRVRRDVGSRLGSMRTWLDFHIYTGYLGGVLIFFHASYTFQGYVFWLCFVPMIIAILTGVLGRYVYYLIPRSEAGRAMDSGEITEKLKEMGARIEALVEAGKGGSSAVQQIRSEGLLALPVEEQAATAWWTTLFESFSAGLRRRSRAKALMARLAKLGKLDGKARKEMEQLVDGRSILEGAGRRLRSLEVLSGSWRQVHIWASYLMFVAMLVHTVYAWVYLGPRAFFAR